MLRLYRTNKLTVSEVREFSVYADGGSFGPIALRDTYEGIDVGDVVEAFVYLDAEEEVVATMKEAMAHVGECAYLEVVSSGDRGTFLDWGLPKDLLLPYSEQTREVREGDLCFVYIFQDESQRPTATMRLHRYLDEDCDDLQIGEPVNLIIASKTDLGFKAVINDEQLGLIFHSELSRPLEIGTRMGGWVKDIREDGKVNLSISKLDGQARDNLQEMILSELRANNGRLEISDKSSPDLIYSVFKVSKKNFKRALGHLYKQRLINISREFIELVSNNKPDDN
jgi:hypothetical protein